MVDKLAERIPSTSIERVVANCGDVTLLSVVDLWETTIEPFSADGFADLDPSFFDDVDAARGYVLYLARHERGIADRLATRSIGVARLRTGKFVVVLDAEPLQ